MENKLMTAAQAEKEAKQLSTANVWTDKAAFDQMLRVATMFAQSNLVPDKYKNKPQDCFIAVDMASRMNVSPIVVMQNLDIVRGRPSWSGSSCFALIESCGKFRSPNYVPTGTKGTPSWGCYVTARRVSDGERVDGTEITMAMAQMEGWTTNPKWKSMPEQMLKYRAAAFFARAYCADALMGLQTTEEIEDTTPTAAKNLNAELDNIE